MEASYNLINRNGFYKMMRIAEHTKWPNFISRRRWCSGGDFFKQAADNKEAQ